MVEGRTWYLVGHTAALVVLLLGNVDTVTETPLGRNVDGVVRLERFVALVPAELVKVVAEAAALAVFLVAQDQDSIVLRPAALLKGVELLALRYVGRFPIVTDNFGLSLSVGLGASRSLNGIECGRGATTDGADANVLVTDGASGSGETGQEGNWEEKSEAHGGCLERELYVGVSWEAWYDTGEPKTGLKLALFISLRLRGGGAYLKIRMVNCQRGQEHPREGRCARRAFTYPPRVPESHDLFSLSSPFVCSPPRIYRPSTRQWRFPLSANYNHQRT